MSKGSSRGQDVLRQCAFFASLRDASIAELLRIGQRRMGRMGEILFSEGDPADALFVLESGVVDLLKHSPEGKEQLVRTVGRGEVFAEAAMFAGEAYPATAVVRRDAELLAIRKDRFLSLVRRQPDIAFAIMGAMAKLLRHLNALLADLSLGSVGSRLAAFLLAKSRERGAATFSLGITKRELALRLGTVPETLSRNLRKLKESGAIDVRGDFVTIQDAAALEAVSGG